jgi:UDP-glucose 4-epimerase
MTAQFLTPDSSNSGVVLVTGAAGFIGSHTVDHLLANGYEVVGIDSLTTGRIDNLASARRFPRFRFVQGDLLAPGLLDDIVDEAEPTAVIHLAGLAGVADCQNRPEDNQRLNVQATHHVSDVASRSSSVRHLIYSSSAAVYGASAELPLKEDAKCSPLGNYGHAKLESERHLLTLAKQRSSLSVTVLRYFNVYGPRQNSASTYAGVISRFVHALASGDQPVVHGDGMQTRDFVSVADVARANALALRTSRSGPAVVNVCTGRGTSLLSLLTALGELTNRRIAPRHLPSQEGDIRHSRGCPIRAEMILGFAARDDLNSGLRTFLQCMSD